MDGKVKWFNHKKGFGFVTGDDEKDYFVHHTALPEGVMLNEEDSISFNPVETERGWQAQDVSLLNGASDSGGDDTSTPEPDAAPEEEAPTEDAPAEEAPEEETPEEEAPADETEPASETEEE